MESEAENKGKQTKDLKSKSIPKNTIKNTIKSFILFCQYHLDEHHIKDILDRKRTTGIDPYNRLRRKAHKETPLKDELLELI